MGSCWVLALEPQSDIVSVLVFNLQSVNSFHIKWA